MTTLVMDPADMIGPVVTLGAMPGEREVTIVTCGDYVYAVANKRAALLQYEAVNVRGDARIFTVTYAAWANFRYHLVRTFHVSEHLDENCTCLAAVRDECTCGRYGY